MVMTVLIILTFDHKTFTNAWHNVVSKTEANIVDKITYILRVLLIILR